MVVIKKQEASFGHDLCLFRSRQRNIPGAETCRSKIAWMIKARTPDLATQTRAATSAVVALGAIIRTLKAAGGLPAVPDGSAGGTRLAVEIARSATATPGEAAAEPGARPPGGARETPAAPAAVGRAGPARRCGADQRGAAPRGAAMELPVPGARERGVRGAGRPEGDAPHASKCL